ncbi:MAG: FliM/FliN family flagellar motor switch protein [Pirellulales bacterium]|nr:FliM/FliN family flagellar motor switch protein [Pirellulales bacterium]
MRRFKLAPLHGTAATTRAATLDMLRDVKFDARINLGRTYMHRKNVSELGQGDIVPLDKVVDEPVEILVGGRLIARGDIFMLNNKFCVRVSEMTGGVATV